MLNVVNNLRICTDLFTNGSKENQIKELKPTLLQNNYNFTLDSSLNMEYLGIHKG